MTAFVARLFRFRAVTELEAFVTVSLFCGIGLRISIGVLMLDKYMPGEWF
jgi:hypothetical protein